MELIRVYLHIEDLLQIFVAENQDHSDGWDNR